MENYNNFGATPQTGANMGFDNSTIFNQNPMDVAGQQINQINQQVQQVTQQVPVQNVTYAPVQQVAQTPVTERQTLGSKLKAISEQAKPRMELNNLSQLLMEKAAEGYSDVKFTDLRTHIPTFASRGVDDFKAWCIQEELILSGQVNPSTAAWEFRISW